MKESEYRSTMVIYIPTK